MAEPGLLLGLDAGNTVIKAVLFDREGNQLARASATAPRTRRRPAMSSATSTSSGQTPPW